MLVFVTNLTNFVCFSLSLTHINLIPEETTTNDAVPKVPRNNKRRISTFNLRVRSSFSRLSKLQFLFCHCTGRPNSWVHKS